MVTNMRWLKRLKKDLPPEFNINSEEAYETVLQMEVSQGGLPSWRDVPTVDQSDTRDYEGLKVNIHTPIFGNDPRGNGGFRS